jgi:hypothetical protein
MEDRSLQTPHYFGAAEKRMKTAGAKRMRGCMMGSAQERCETLQTPHYFGAAEKRIKTVGAKLMRRRTMGSAQER